MSGTWASAFSISAPFGNPASEAAAPNIVQQKLQGTARYKVCLSQSRLIHKRERHGLAALRMPRMPLVPLGPSLVLEPIVRALFRLPLPGCAARRERGCSTGSVSNKRYDMLSPRALSCEPVAKLDVALGAGAM